MLRPPEASERISIQEETAHDHLHSPFFRTPRKEQRSFYLKTSKEGGLN
jgi:hypothetical protein